MSQFGEVDEEYVLARRALLDAADALSEHLDAVVLVGAQAIYLQTGAAEFAIAEYTTDADLSIQPAGLRDAPRIPSRLQASDITPVIRGDQQQPGQWLSPDRVPVDLMVPDRLAGSGSRSADLGVHGRRTARRAKGLEAAFVDRESMTVSALEPGDDRSIEMNVAGPGALLVAKIHKIADRSSTPDRLIGKDALDVLRLLQCVSTDELCARLVRLRQDELSRDVTDEAIAQMPLLFGSSDSLGVSMAVRAVGDLENPDVIASSMVALANDLLDAL